MKLFNKGIDTKLFKQFKYGGNLHVQDAVVKIFNPTGNQVWFIVNSDPDDPDYLWAIVNLGYGVEVGSVSRSDLEEFVGKYGLRLERDLSFDPMNAQDCYEGALQGNRFEEGGRIRGKVPASSITLSSSIEGDFVATVNSFERANEVMEFIWKLNLYSNVKYSIVYKDGTKLEGTIDLEPQDFHRPHRNTILSWHLKNYWKNVANSPVLPYLSQQDIDYAKELFKDYAFDDDGTNDVDTHLADRFEIGTPAIYHQLNYKGEPFEQTGEISFNKESMLYNKKFYSAGKLKGIVLKGSHDLTVPEWVNVETFYEASAREQKGLPFVVTKPEDEFEDGGVMAHVEKINVEDSTDVSQEFENGGIYSHGGNIAKVGDTVLHKMSGAKIKVDDDSNNQISGMVINEVEGFPKFKKGESHSFPSKYVGTTYQVIKFGQDYEDWKKELIAIIMKEANLAKDEMALTESDLKEYYKKRMTPHQVYFEEWEQDGGHFYKMEKGGKIENQYAGRSPQNIWDNYSEAQRKHFLTDHSGVIKYMKRHYRNIPDYHLLTDEIKHQSHLWEDLDSDIKTIFEEHVQEGEYENGGKIRNQYAGRAAGDVWDNLNETQRMHFMTDHLPVDFLTPKNLERASNSNWSNLNDDVVVVFSNHVKGGQYDKGGKTEIKPKKKKPANQASNRMAKAIAMAKKNRLPNQKWQDAVKEAHAELRKQEQS